MSFDLSYEHSSLPTFLLSLKKYNRIEILLFFPYVKKYNLYTKNISCLAGHFTNIQKTDTKKTKTGNNYLCIIQSVVPCGTQNT